MNFSKSWIKWIAKCLSTARFSILINGSPEGYFNSNCGLREGDPLLPFLFILAIEAITTEMERVVSNKNFDLIKQKEDCEISHLIFVDDLLIFGKANKKSLSALETILIGLSRTAGLVMNKSK